jgi:Domain of unknown function (DUF4214)/Methyltransferase domain
MRLKARLEVSLPGDTAFIERAFREILGRAPDLDGLAHYRRVLREGVGRTAVLLDIMRSDEFLDKLTKAPASVSSLPDLRSRRPAQFRTTVDRSNSQSITVFAVESAADFDWLESAILQHGYYEKPGVWNLGIDIDKRVVAEMIASFAPRRALELGCAAGAVLQCLDDAGVAAEGVEISAMAIAKASPQIRERIHRGDLLTMNLPADYDMVFGLDVFEHLNPNRIDEYLSRLAALTTDDAFLFCNIPAFGEDPVFGTVFQLYVQGWEQDVAAGRPFRRIHVDALGYPIHGHLIWADWRWWTSRFEAHGFRRQPDLERAFHAKYDRYMSAHTPARRAYFVYAKGTQTARSATIAGEIRRLPSPALS